MKKLPKHIYNTLLVMLLLSVIFTIASTILISINNNLSFRWTRQCSLEFFELFSLSIESLKAGISIAAILLVVHQIRQIKKQTKDSRTVSTFRDYISHREAFFSLLKSNERSDFSIQNVEELYRMFFHITRPENSNLNRL